MLGFGGFVGSEAATVNDGDTLNGSTHVTVTKDPSNQDDYHINDRAGHGGWFGYIKYAGEYQHR